MFQQKSLKELKSILSFLKSKSQKANQGAVRDEKRDYELMSQSDLDYILKSEIPTLEKKKLLLSQMGLLRINLFSECYERATAFEEKNQLDKAVQTMNDYAVNVAIPFMSSRKQPSLIGRFTRLLSQQRLLEPDEYVQRWKTQYHSWFEPKKKPIFPELLESEQREKYNGLRLTFHMLYTLSFSDDNFPPSPTIIVYDPSRIKV